jgi:DNA-binding CsgD family transcriptional regulator
LVDQPSPRLDPSSPAALPVPGSLPTASLLAPGPLRTPPDIHASRDARLDTPTPPGWPHTNGDRRVTRKGRTMIDGSHQSVLRRIGARRRGRVRARPDDSTGPGRHRLGTAQGHPASAPAASGVLTRRELEVLRLVATGESDQGIADRLSVSRRTINTHVSTILSKLEVATRTAAAVTAGRSGLL